jgi:hypothetical protein
MRGSTTLIRGNAMTKEEIQKAWEALAKSVNSQGKIKVMKGGIK